MKNNLSLIFGSFLLISGSVFAGTIQGTVTATPPKYLGESVVFVKNAPGPFTNKTVNMDQINLQFVPHVLAITVRDTVKFQNSEEIMDHMVSSPSPNGYDLGIIRAGQSKTFTFNTEGAFTQLCNMHPAMLAYIFVGQNPYSSVVDTSGHFKIDNVPAGTYTLSVWNSHLKAADQTVEITDTSVANTQWTLSP